MPPASTSVVLHLGLGSFHRAHQAVYLQRLMDAGDTRWSISGANLRPDSPEVLAALRAQGGSYTLETVSPTGEYNYQLIESIREVLPYESTLASVIARGADPATRIISFTVTEAGYYLDAHARLDLSHPDLAADIERAKTGEPGNTIYGGICAILRARMVGHGGPVTLLNCDNLRHNGARFRRGLIEFIGRVGDTDLIAWVRANITSPNTMVDRITPRPVTELRARVMQATRRDDAAPVSSESFMEWVIEDDFIAGRPEWERVGARLVDLVQPYEEAKIRLLNATHSAIAWAGTLIGLQFIHEGARTPAIRGMAYDYVTNDAIPCLNRPGAPSPIDLAAYRDVVLERFGNPAIRDTNARVAMDAFAKIPGMIAPTIHDRLGEDESIDSVAILPALFLALLERWHAGDLPYTYQDQNMDDAVAHAICTAANPIEAFAANTSLWGRFAGDWRLVDALSRAHRRVLNFVQAANR